MFALIFNLGARVLARLKNKHLIDGRAGCSGRKPHVAVRDMIDNFWKNEVDHEPSHYNSTSVTQTIIGINSVAHGWLVFMAKHFNDKYNECVAKSYFPGITPRVPSNLGVEDVPKIACEDCISRASNKIQVVCKHIPKLTFFKQVTGTFKLTLKRPGSDQCERCNTLHNRIALHRALGRHADADAEEDRLYQHQEKLPVFTPLPRGCVL